MGLENLKKSLTQEAQAEAKRLQSDAQKQASRATEDAREKAAKIRADARERAKAMVESETNERMSSAELKGKRLVADAMDRKMKEALEMVWKDFAKIPETAGYEKRLGGLISEAEKELGPKCVVYVNKGDAKAARKFSKNVSEKAADIAGGAITTTPDGRISIDNSLEAVFEQRKEEAKKAIYADLMKAGRK